jgi:HSP20 family protein
MGTKEMKGCRGRISGPCGAPASLRGLEREEKMSTAMSTQGSRQMLPLFRPFQALRQEFEQFFNRLGSDWGDGNWQLGEFKAACDLSETDDAYQVRMDVPGIQPDDITVQVTGDTVQIFGERKEEKEEHGKTFHRMERCSGRFSETLRLPSGVKEDEIEAEFHDGVLTVTLPKTEVTKTRTVRIKADGKSNGK